MVKHFIQNIPDGVTFTPTNSKQWGKIPAQKAHEEEGSANGKKVESDICSIGDFRIDISIIEKNALLSMRLILPADGYKVLKNRKNARIQRLRKKNCTTKTNAGFVDLQTENEKLREFLALTQSELREA